MNQEDGKGQIKETMIKFFYFIVFLFLHYKTYKRKLKVLSWNIGKYEGKLGTVLKEESIKKKFEVLDDLIKNENPDIFCIVEGTISKVDTRLKELFETYEYDVYFEPEFINLEEYKNRFEFETYDSYGLKLFIKKNFKHKIEPFDPSRAIHKGRLVNIELVNQQGVFIFLHRNMSTTDKEQHEFIRAIYDWCYKGKLGLVAKNIYILGDFNLTPWSSDYFSDKSGYLLSEFVENIYKIKKRNDPCFYNPVINYLATTDKINIGGTFYSNNYGWGIFDFALIRDYNKDKLSFELITSSKGYEILNTNDGLLVKDFINHDFDHIPIKLEIEL